MNTTPVPKIKLETKEIINATHLPSTEQPAEFNRVVKDFLRDVEA